MFITAKQKLLLRLLSDGEFHSGAELAEILGLSRSAVWKHLHGLAFLGLGHIAVNGKGYRLPRRLELLDSDCIFGHLSAASRNRISRLEIHDHIESTNTHLVNLAQNGAASGIICLAEQQSAGKGRRGKQWVSPYGNNVLLSVLWRYQQGPAALSALSLAVGVAVIRALRQVGVTTAGLKWPNDILGEGKKLGGILIEVAGENEGPCYAVTGIGINLHLSADDALTIDQPWTDIEKLTGGLLIGRNQLAAQLIDHLLPVLGDYEKTGISAYLEEWRRHDYLKGAEACLTFGNQRIDGTLEGVNDEGLLLLRDRDRNLRTFASGEVSVRRK